jgi:aldose 1-epimerase
MIHARPPRCDAVRVATVETLDLFVPGENGLRAAFAPEANMVLHSLTLGGRELLEQRNGLGAYVESGSTMGVPLLHPWANRLAAYGYTAAGTTVALDQDSELFKRDEGGLPIHGALPSLCSWEVVDTGSGGDTASLLARLEWDRRHPAFELFPFPHRLEYRARITGGAIEIAVALEPTEEAPVPVSFGFHPYLSIPGGTRAGAEITLPAGRHLVLDASMIPTGETEPCDPGLRQLGDASWDDGFSELVEPVRFLLGGRDGETALMFVQGYRFAQVFAPPGSDFVCFEPMTAPTNALVAGGPNLTVVEPGGRHEAAFAIAAR